MSFVLGVGTNTTAVATLSIANNILVKIFRAVKESFGSIMSLGSFYNCGVVILAIVVVSFFILHVAFKLLELLVLGVVGVLIVCLGGGGFSLDGDNLLNVIVILNYSGG